MLTPYWQEAARLDQEETAASLARFAQLSQAAMEQFTREFPGAPCLPGPPGHTVSFQLAFEETVLRVAPMPPEPCNISDRQRWWLQHPDGACRPVPREGAAGLYRVCRQLCPESVFQRPADQDIAAQ